MNQSPPVAVNPLILGILVAFGSLELTLPPLNFLQLQRLDPYFKTVASGQPSAEWFTAITKIVHASISRNYPDLTEEDVGEMLDMSNFQRAFDAVLSVSGMETAKEAAAGQPS
jgi:hypothetical protein